MTEQQHPSNYERIGGESGLHIVVDRFYDYMELLDEAQSIRKLHPRDLRSSREKLFMFLSGWLGGPDRYIAAFGHPRLRARHLPFSIGSEERDQWMLCMRKALDDTPIDAAFREQLIMALNQTATFMINRSPS